MVARRCLAFVLTVAGCAGDPVVVPHSDEVFVSVVVAPMAAAPANVELQAFLLRAGTPLRSPYLVADRFEMRRVSDGALFDWQAVTPRDSVVAGGSLHVLYGDANYRLPTTGTGGRFGRQEINAGDTFVLTVEAAGRSVTGSVTVPSVPMILRGVDWATADSISWRAATGAVGYSIVTQDFFPLSDFTTDTLYRFGSRIPDNLSARGTVVRAYEPQLWTYISDRRLGRSGLTGALGVFGAYNADSLPPRRN